MHFIHTILAIREDSDAFAYYHRRHGIGKFTHEEQVAAMQAWCKWENATMALYPKTAEELKKSIKESEDTRCVAKLETHYSARLSLESHFSLS